MLYEYDEDMFRLPKASRGERARRALPGVSAQGWPGYRRGHLAGQPGRKRANPLCGAESRRFNGSLDHSFDAGNGGTGGSVQTLALLPDGKVLIRNPSRTNVERTLRQILP